MSDLFDGSNPAGWPLLPPSRRNGPQESKDAAQSMIHAAMTQRMDVLKIITEAGDRGIHDEAGAERAGLELRSYGPRRWELVKIGYVERTGERTKTRSGRTAALWRAVKPPAEGGAK